MKKIFLCSIFILQLAACTKETEFTTVKSTTVENTAENKVEVKTENFVIRKRDSSFPLKLDPNNAESAINRACQLIEELGAVSNR